MTRLITGTIRSATKYASYVMQAIGLDMPHEKYGKDGIVSPIHTFDREFDVVLHQVRHPLRSLETMGTLIPGTWQRLAVKVGSIPGPYNSFKNMMRLWVEWNNEIDLISDYCYQVEEIERNWTSILKHLDVKPCPFPEGISEKTNTRRKQFIVTLDTLYRTDEGLADKIVNKAAIYGYNNLK
jgi:hypothetical protein